MWILVLVWMAQSRTVFVGRVRLIIGKIKKTMQETDTGGLQVYATPAVSVFLIAFLYYSIVGSKATSQHKQFAEIYSKTSVPIQ